MFRTDPVEKSRRRSGSQADGRRWVVRRRYGDFRALEAGLRDAGCAGAPPLPGKVLFGNLNDRVIDARRVDLEKYLRAVVADDGARETPAALEFLGAQELRDGAASAREPTGQVLW